MATHDYVIDNSTGANVRSDLNNVLQAILTNNSSSSAPSTTAAYMWWADTTTGILKIRNSANDGWVELLQLDGTLTLEDGSASTPALAFRDDLNTGIYSSAADKFNIATGGVERLELGSQTVFNEDGADVDFRIEGDSEENLFYVDAGNDRIGIGTSSPEATLHEAITTAKTNSVEHMLILEHLSSGTTTTGFGTGIRFRGERNNGVMQNIGDIEFAADVNSGSNISCALVFKPALSGVVTERMRIDSSGRFLLNMSTSVTGGKFQVNNTFNTFFAASNDTQGCVLQLQKTRSTSPGSYTIVQDGDTLGELQFKGSNGSASVIGAKILAKVNGTPGSGNDIPTDLIFRMQPDGSGSTQEAMRIRSDRTVEIATEGAIAGFTSSHINSGAPLKIYKSSGSTHAGLQLIWDHFNTSTGISQRIQFTVGDDASSDGFNNAGFIGIEKVDSWQSGAGRSSALIFGNTSAATESEKMRMTSSGQLLVGTSNTNSCSAKLIVQADSIPSYYANSGGLNVNVTNSNDIHCAELFQGRYNKRVLTHSHSNTGSVTFDVFEQNDSNVGSITGGGSSIAFNTSSDYRLKENIVNITDGITRLKQLIPRRFNWISDSTNTLVDGFIAHEVSPVIPEAVTGEKDALEEDGSIEPQAMDYGKVTPLLTAALQEAIAKIEVLETKVAALEAA